MTTHFIPPQKITNSFDVLLKNIRIDISDSTSIRK